MLACSGRVCELINLLFPQEPDWDKILESEWIGTEMMALAEQHGSLQNAEDEVHGVGCRV